MNERTSTRAKLTQTSAKTLKTLLIPNPVIVLGISSVVAILIAVLVFGKDGMVPDSDVEDIVKTIGVGIIAAMVATIIDRVHFFNDIEERIGNSFREANGVATSLTMLGIYTAHPRFDFSTIFREARKGETVSWLDTYCPVDNVFLEELERAFSRGVHVRMLIIHPDSETSRFRSIEMAGSLETGEAYKSGLQSFILKMKKLADRSGGNLQIRFYRDLPCVPMYLVGKSPAVRKGYFSLFLVRPTASCQHIELSAGEWLTDMAKYFQAKWDRQEAKLQ